MKKARIVETEPLLAIMETFDIARMRSKIVVVTGPSGRGKSTAIRHYRRDRFDTVLHAGPEHKKASNLLRVLAALPVSTHNTSNELLLFERLRNVFRYCADERIIIIDEAQYLGHEALEYVRHINEDIGVGIALVGQSELLRVLKQERQRPLWGRVVRHLQVDYTLKSFQVLARGLGIESVATNPFAQYCRSQGLHRAVEIVEAARELCADGAEISERALMEAIAAGGFDGAGVES